MKIKKVEKLVTNCRKFINNRNEKKTQILMNKPVYLRLLILDLSKTLMYKLWYDYVKPKYDENANFFLWIETASFFM